MSKRRPERPSFQSAVVAGEYGQASKLRIAFIHPDLGIGGAERLVVDAAVGLQKRGHTVEIFTSHHDDSKGGRSFEETRDGTLNVHVLGASIVPSSIFGAFTIICAILRQFHLTFLLLLSNALFGLSNTPLLGSIVSLFLIPVDRSFKPSSSWSTRRQMEPFDVIVVDQLSASIPFLRWFGSNRIVFYCHFPDLLLSPSRTMDHEGLPKRKTVLSLSNLLNTAYRIPIDALEESTTGEADKILVNSEFTARVFMKTFPAMRRNPRVVYPAVDVEAYGKVVRAADEDKWILNSKPTFLSINRFEGKKDIALAIDAFSRAREEHPDIRLIIAGGYDPRLADNVTTLASLQTFATALDLPHYTFCSTPLTASKSPKSSKTPAPTISTSPPSSPSNFPVVFLLNMTSAQKSHLLSSPSVVALFYTPSYEHLGIVPLEAMASGLPILATNTGGPTETIVDDGIDAPTSTGLLRAPSAEVWNEAILELMKVGPERRKAIGLEGMKRTREFYSRETLAKELEKACVDAYAISEPILFETGTLKLGAFIAIGTFVFLSGVIAVFADELLVWWTGGKSL